MKKMQVLFSVSLFFLSLLLPCYSVEPNTASTKGEFLAFGTTNFSGINSKIIEADANVLQKLSIDERFLSKFQSEEKKALLLGLWFDFRKASFSALFDEMTVQELSLRYGWLQVKSKPANASIIVSGEKWDATTNTKPVGMKAGKYIVELQKDGFFPASGTIDVIPVKKVTFRKNLKRKK